MKQLTAKQINKQLKGLSDEYGCIDFSDQDFTGFEVNLSGLKTDKNIFNSEQEAGEDIFNDHQEAGQYIFNSGQKAGEDIHNDDQEITPKTKQLTIEELLKIASEKEGVKVELKQ